MNIFLHFIVCKFYIKRKKPYKQITNLGNDMLACQGIWKYSDVCSFLEMHQKQDGLNIPVFTAKKNFNAKHF